MNIPFKSITVSQVEGQGFDPTCDNSSRHTALRHTISTLTPARPPSSHPLKPPLSLPPQVMWVCNLCRKQQEILTKSGAWFYGAGDPRGVFEGPQGRRHEEAPQEKKAKLQDPSLYQGPSGDRSGRHPGLPRQHSLNNGAGDRHGDSLLDR